MGNLGHFSNGLCMGTASAQLLRQLMLGQETIVDPAAYDPKSVTAYFNQCIMLSIILRLSRGSMHPTKPLAPVQLLDIEINSLLVLTLVV